MKARQARRVQRMARMLLLLAVTLLFSSASCRKGVANTPLRTIPSRLSEATPATLNDSITTTITLRGLPVQETIDAAGHLVVSNGLRNVAVGSHVLLQGGGAGVSDEAGAGYAWTLRCPVAPPPPWTIRHQGRQLLSLTLPAFTLLS